MLYSSFIKCSIKPLIASLLLTLVSLTLCAEQVADSVAPEFGTNAQQLDSSYSSKVLKTQKFIAVTANPISSQIASDILSQGGNAIDAAIAAQFALGLVEPQSSGLGGGAFLLYYDAKNKRLTTYDGRETAPKDIPSDIFLNAEKKPMSFFEAVIGGRSVGTPGTVKLLSDIHKKYSLLAWPDLLAPSIELATKGFTVSERLASSIKRDGERLKSDPTAKAYFFPNGKPLTTGDLLKNHDYAKTLQYLSSEGGDAFYSKEFSKHLVNKVRGSENSGYLSQQDFDNYRVVERDSLCGMYQGYKVCGMAPPSSGASTILQILGILENFSLKPKDSTNLQTWQLISDASRLAFADRGAYVADPDFFAFDKKQLTPNYLKARAKLIKRGKTLNEVKPGNLNQNTSLVDHNLDLPSTTHFVIVDAHGNIVSMTSTIENAFGSRLMTQGFLLNNELTDFSFHSEKNGKRVANRVEAGKRPRSSMAPTIVFKDDQPYLALGSPGGSRIINYVANTLIRHLSFGESVEDAVAAPHIVNRFGTLELENHRFNDAEINSFLKLGYTTQEKDLNSGIHAVLFREDGLLGVADHRREGMAAGN